MMGLRIWLEARLTTSVGVLGLRAATPRPLFAIRAAPLRVYGISRPSAKIPRTSRAAARGLDTMDGTGLALWAGRR